MTNTQRNTTVISSLLAIILAVGFIMLHQLGKELKVITDKNTKLQAEVFKYNKLIAMRAKLEQDFAELRLMLANQSKVIAQVDSPASTYKYLLNLMQWMGKNLDFDFAMSKGNTAGMQYNEYILSGKSDYRVLGDFIKNLEYQRTLLTLEDVSLAQDVVANSDSVMYSIVFRTHYSLDGTPIEDIKQKPMSIPSSSFSAFRPKVYESPPETDIDPSLLQIDKATLVGITESRVFVRDQWGVIRILTVGSPVAYGYLYGIDRPKDRVIFRLNQYGIAEDKSLFLNK